jgi:hypothetical protein
VLTNEKKTFIFRHKNKKGEVMVTLTINIDKVSHRAREVLLAKTHGNFIIDYAYNNLIVYEGIEEVEIFSFTPYFQMDNRYNRSEIYFDEISGNIVIKLHNTRMANE